MRDGDWVLIARKEASEFARLQRYTMWAGITIGTIVSATMAYCDASLKWMMVVSFPLVVLSVSEPLQSLSHRLDIGRSYLEQCCSSIEQDVSEICLRG